MNVGKAVRYAFEDKDWPSKLGVALLVGIVPILNFAFSGYMVEVLRRVAQGEERPLPDWSNLGDYFIKGLYVLAASLAYGLVPSLITMPLILLASFGPLLAIPFMEQMDEGMAVAALIIFSVLFVGLMLLAMALSLVVSVVQMAGLLRFATGRQQLEEFFYLRDNLNYVRNHIGQIVVLYLIVMGIGLAIVLPVVCIYFFLALIPVCGPLLGMALMMGVNVLISLFSTHLYGQLARQTGLVSPAALDR